MTFKNYWRKGQNSWQYSPVQFLYHFGAAFKKKKKKNHNCYPNCDGECYSGFNCGGEYYSWFFNYSGSSGNNALTSVTAAPLPESVNRDGCSESRLCASEPADCDPSTSSNCFFLSADQKIGRNFSIELSGQAAGYIAVTFSTDNTLGGHDITYICAADGSTVVLITATFNNDVLIVTLLDVSEGKGRVDGNTIQCSFCVVLPESSTRVRSLASALHTGSYNATSGALGTPNTVIKTNQLDFTNANATVTNTLTSNSTTATPTTSSYAPTLHHSLLQTLLVTLAVLGLAML
ncbi:putative ferric-chelate reductase 1 [Gouania willdenowi]|uniref:putative ferric-chelate reductase 1 n=1 Tax=Gouania willdenowi TaxID=441366 RepID=UPI0010549893|nr:putative ferric-chelate reductase 1 [Gouania willdenowi]